MNILIVRTDRIGDVVLTTPAIRALREAYPKARISILISPVTKDLVEGNPYLDDVIVDDRKKMHKGLIGHFHLIRQLRRKKFDLAIVFHTKKRTNLTCFLAGIPLRVGYKNNKYGFLLNDPIADVRYKGEKHETEYCLDVLRHLGIDVHSLKPYVPIQKEHEQWIDQFWAQNHINAEDQLIAIHAGASDSAKRWPTKYFAELMNDMVERYHCKIVLIGAADICNVSKEILQYASNISKENQICIFDLTGQTSVGQMVSLLKQCSLLISNDSGPVHVAAGIGTPVVSIFTRNQPGINPQRWKPLGKRSRVVSVSEDYSQSFQKSGTTDAFYLEKIKPSTVLEAIDSIFKLC